MKIVAFGDVTYLYTIDHSPLSGIVLMQCKVLTASFHSRTHFSIHGTRLWVKNSRINLPVDWASASDISSSLVSGIKSGTRGLPLSSGNSMSADCGVAKGTGDVGLARGDIDPG